MNLLRSGRSIATQFSYSALTRLPNSLYSTTTAVNLLKKKPSEEIFIPKTPQFQDEIEDPKSSPDISGEEIKMNWPRPSEIPWQGKVANSVNLKKPIQLHTCSDGKTWAATVIAQENSNTSASSLRIPLIFEGDLAHVASSHLKEDHVHIDGQLSADPPPFTLNCEQSNLQVRVQNVNFVDGSPSKKSWSNRKIIVPLGKNLCSAPRAFYISCSSNYKISVYSFGTSNGRRFSSNNYSNTCFTDDCHAHSTQSMHEISSGEDHPIFKSSCLQHWFKNWQEQRKHKLTASTFAGAIGLWPRRRVQLWLEKIGQLKPFTGNEATSWNNIKEEEALERYKLITGNSVLHPEFQIYKKTSPEDDWLAASPDGTVEQFVYELPSQGVLEIKCPYFHGNMGKAYPWTRIPLHYIPQAQGLLEILDRDWMDFYVWTPIGSSLFRVYRDEVYWNLMKIALSDFWWNHVEPAREVCLNSVITEPLYELRSYRPSPRHELAVPIVYESKRLVDESKLLVLEINGFIVD